MKILKVKTHPLFDIFTGDGWLNWSRYLIKKGKLIYIGGTKIIDKQVLANVVKATSDAKSTGSKQ